MSHTVKEASFTHYTPINGANKNYVTFSLEDGPEFINMQFCIHEPSKKLVFLDHHTAQRGLKTGIFLDDNPNISEELYKLYQENN